MNKTTKITVIAVSVVLLAVALFFAIRAIKKYLENKSFNDQDTVDNPKTKAEREKNRKAYANIFANQARTAFNPTGNGWMIDIDGTSTDAVMKVSLQASKRERSAIQLCGGGLQYSIQIKSHDTTAKRIVKYRAIQILRHCRDAGCRHCRSLGCKNRRWVARRSY